MIHPRNSLVVKTIKQVSCVRRIASYVYLHAQPNLPKLRVPLLKSSSYFGHTSSRLDRTTNEDAYSAQVLNITGSGGPHDHVFNFSVFDGHGSALVSKYLASHLAETVESYPESQMTKGYLQQMVDRYKSFYNEKLPGTPGAYWSKWSRYLARNYDKLYEESGTVYEKADNAFKMRLFFAYLDLDLTISEHPGVLDPSLAHASLPPGGSTATSVFLYPLYSSKPSLQYFDTNTVSRLIISHLGDTKCILVDKFGAAHALTSNHHPDSPVEHMRLLKLTDFAVTTDSFGEERFFNLANTRAFGDCAAKTRGVTAEPDTSSFTIGDARFIEQNCPHLRESTVGKIGGDESFLVLCTDGITNFCSDQEIADLVTSSYNLKNYSPQKCTEEVIKYVEAIGGNDNATCLVVRLNGWGKWPVIDRTGKLREEKLNDAVFSNRRSGSG